MEIVEFKTVDDKIICFMLAQGDACIRIIACDETGVLLHNPYIISLRSITGTFVRTGMVNRHIGIPLDLNGRIAVSKS